jgi:hypothetical protein
MRLITLHTPLQNIIFNDIRGLLLLIPIFNLVYAVGLLLYLRSENLESSREWISNNDTSPGINIISGLSACALIFIMYHEGINWAITLSASVAYASMIGRFIQKLESMFVKRQTI